MIGRKNVLQSAELFLLHWAKMDLMVLQNRNHWFIHLHSVSLHLSQLHSVRVQWGGYSYIRVLPDEFLLKSVVITVDFKRNSSGRTRVYEYAHPPCKVHALMQQIQSNMW